MKDKLLFIVIAIILFSIVFLPIITINIIIIKLIGGYYSHPLVLLLFLIIFYILCIISSLCIEIFLMVCEYFSLLKYNDLISYLLEFINDLIIIFTLDELFINIDLPYYTKILIPLINGISCILLEKN